MPDITTTLPTDTSTRRYQGVERKMPAGRQRGSTDFAYTHVEGPQAHDAVADSQPVPVGGVAETTVPAAVADADAVRAWFDERGRLVITLKHTDGTALVDANGLKVQLAAAGIALDAATLAALETIELGATTLAALESITIGTALPAGTNNIGDVDVLTVPADPFGANVDATVAAGAAGSISAKLRRATQGLEDLKTLIVLAAGANVIGKVGIDQTTPGTTNAVQLAQASLTMTHSNFTVTTTSATYLATNANRKYARFQNDGATIIYLNFGATAVAGQGIRLEANGGVFEISAANGNLTTGGVRAIVASGTSLLLITEGV